MKKPSTGMREICKKRLRPLFLLSIPEGEQKYRWFCKPFLLGVTNGISLGKRVQWRRQEWVPHRALS